ncbi:substrate-binding domain-containing protein [Cohnella algarum]|uniref:substrate-binding domain-containing protein n=1 Tax=Cohnella algarum TaxID=2044859 RepID=UPI0019686C49|nr:substrate-binding domain-containing protein [Cohnella algarum]MBN2983630.1 substrate-binding domain-containing protein [Cohnella algarum]
MTTGVRGWGRLLTLLLALAAAGGAVYCATGRLADMGGGSDRPRIVVIIKESKSMEFWQVFESGAEAAAKEFEADIAVIGPGKETDVDAQIAMAEKAAAERPDAIVLAAADYNRLAPAAETIGKLGIPLIMADSAVNSDRPKSFIATDNVAAGEKVGRLMAEQLSATGGKVAVMSFVQGSASQIDRERGVRNALEKAPGVEVVGTFYSDGIERKAYETTLELLKEHPDLKGIVGLNEASSVGPGKALRDAGAAGRVKLVGFDSSVEEVKLLEEGVMQGTIVQRPFNMGYLGVKTAVQAIRGEKVPKTIDTGSVIITKANMYEDENQKLLFPFVGE